MTHQPTVSIIIPIYNVTHYLDEAIRSVVLDQYPHKEVVVVNDGSHEQATATIAGICEAYPEVKLVYQKNMGQAPSRRNGISHSTGDYIIFLDADDKLMPGAISYFVKSMAEYPSAIAVYGTKLLIDKEGKLFSPECYPRKEEVASGNVVPALLRGYTLFSHGNICMRRQYIEKVDFPTHLTFGEDWVTWCRLALMGDIIYLGDRPLLCWREHSDNVSKYVFSRPAILHKMLKTVYRDPIFITRYGVKQLRAFHNRHLFQIHSYLQYCYQLRNQKWRAKKHRVLKRRRQRYFPKEKLKVLHVVKWFYAGGCERLLSGIIASSDPEQFEYSVVSLSDQGERMGEIQQTLGVPYKSFEFPYGKPNIWMHIKCWWYIRKQRPDVVKTWLAPSNISGGIIAKLLRKPLIWGIHNVHSTPPFPFDTRFQAKLSRYLPDSVICCSKPAYDSCRMFGFPEHLLNIVINGTDLELFRFTPKGRQRVREELGITDDTLLIGMAAEGTVLKRHPHFIAAAKDFMEAYPQVKVKFILCGKYVTPDNHVFMDQIKSLGMESYIELLGIRDDMPEIYSAMDIHTLDSSREPFGLAVTEAMVCETMCVATNVDVLGELLDDVGIVYECSDKTDSLIHAWKQMIDMPEEEKNRRRKKGRERIAHRYPLSRTAREYEKLYRWTAEIHAA